MVSDVLLLADVIEQYRKMCWDRMGLEALCYISLPALTFDACLKTTRTKLQIVKNIDILQMLETGIRGVYCKVRSFFRTVLKHFCQDLSIKVTDFK